MTKPFVVPSMFEMIDKSKPLWTVHDECMHFHLHLILDYYMRFLFSGNHADALKLLLTNAPVASKGKNEQVKDMALNLVLKVSSISAIINMKFDMIGYLELFACILQ